MNKLKVKQGCVITPTYPDKYFVERGAFVERLVKNWMSEGLIVDVVAPRSIQNICRSFLNKLHFKREFAGSSVYYPSYISLSNKVLGNIDFSILSHNQFKRAFLRRLKKINQPDFYYGQFLLNGGYAAVTAKNLTGIPAFIDIGESVLINQLTDKELSLAVDLVQQADGLFCVSDILKKQVLELGASKDKVVSFPNTVDIKQFYPMDKKKCRKKLGIPQNVPLVIFTGHFISRKGPLRVLKAVESIDTNVKVVFLGRGPQTPSGDKVYHSGPVPNEDVPLWLSASDIFVLPTQSEGHCNAINEAMASGLPIVSSDIQEVRSQVPKEAGLLVDPNNNSELSQAINILLMNKSKRLEMGLNAYNIIKERSQISRAESVLKWISSKIKYNR